MLIYELLVVAGRQNHTQNSRASTTTLVVEKLERKVIYKQSKRSSTRLVTRQLFHKGAFLCIYTRAPSILGRQRNHAGSLRAGSRLQGSRHMRVSHRDCTQIHTKRRLLSTQERCTRFRKPTRTADKFVDRPPRLIIGERRCGIDKGRAPSDQRPEPAEATCRKQVNDSGAGWQSGEPEQK